MRLLKVLDKDMTSPFKSFQFEIGKDYHCNNFNTNYQEECSYGFYATDCDGLLYSYRKDKIIMECEVWGKSVEINEFKRRYENIKIIKEASLEDIKTSLEYANHLRGYNVLESVFPFNPFSVVNEPTENDYANLNLWASVRSSFVVSVLDSVWTSVRASVGDSVRISVWNYVRASVLDSVFDSVRNFIWTSVGDSVWAYVVDSVGASVGDSVLAYVSNLFPGITKWEGINHEKGVNPFQQYIDLWYRGFIPVKINGEYKLVNKNGLCK